MVWELFGIGTSLASEIHKLSIRGKSHNAYTVCEAAINFTLIVRWRIAKSKIISFWCCPRACRAPKRNKLGFSV